MRVAFGLLATDPLFHHVTCVKYPCVSVCALVCVCVFVCVCVCGGGVFMPRCKVVLVQPMCWFRTRSIWYDWFGLALRYKHRAVSRMLAKSKPELPRKVLREIWAKAASARNRLSRAGAAKLLAYVGQAQHAIEPDHHQWERAPLPTIVGFCGTADQADGVSGGGGVARARTSSQITSTGGAQPSGGGSTSPGRAASLFYQTAGAAAKALFALHKAKVDGEGRLGGKTLQSVKVFGLDWCLGWTGIWAGQVGLG
jgi:hypothetical protein